MQTSVFCKINQKAFEVTLKYKFAKTLQHLNKSFYNHAQSKVRVLLVATTLITKHCGTFISNMVKALEINVLNA